MSNAVAIKRLLENEDDLSLYTRVASSPYIESWATKYETFAQGSNYYWYVSVTTENGIPLDVGVEFFLGKTGAIILKPVCYEGRVSIERGTGQPHSRIDRKQTGPSVVLNTYGNETERVIRSMSKAKEDVEKALRPEFFKTIDNVSAIAYALNTVRQIFDAYMHGALQRVKEALACKIVDSLLEADEMEPYNELLRQDYIGTWAQPSGLFKTWKWHTVLVKNPTHEIDVEMLITLFDPHHDATPMVVKTSIFNNGRHVSTMSDKFGTIPRKYDFDISELTGKLYEAVKAIQAKFAATDYSGQSLDVIETALWEPIYQHLNT